jgi:GTP cyclohydrolase I
MSEEKRYLVDIGMRKLPFPITVASKADPKGQATVANISIMARIMHDFEARWIDSFIQILHSHRDKIGTKTLRANIKDYIKTLKASMVKVDFEYPFFIEKLTPVSREKCLVQYLCVYSAKATSLDDDVRISFKIDVPVITTYPQSFSGKAFGLFGQLSVVSIEVQSNADIFPEDIVTLVDSHALAPVYSFLTDEDQRFLIEKIHKEEKTSVVLTDEIKAALSHNPEIEWCSVNCFNFGMMHTYSTYVQTEKSMWVPFSGYEDNI